MIRRLLWLLGLTALAMAVGAASAQAPYVNLTGTLQGSNGTPAINYAINFKPSQMFFIAGTGVVVPASSSCATSVDGSVVLVRNPLVGSIASQVFSGTLPPANYYIETAFYTSTGTVTLVGPETSQQLTSTGGLVIAPPTSGVPSTAAGMRVYIGTSSGTETLQGSTTGSASYTQGIPLVSGASVPAANNTICQQVANDAGWPTGTGYNVSMTDSNGNTLPGYPMQWQLMGGGTTINLSMGLPYYQGTVYFPSPLLASPINHATQSISGPLNFTGYSILNVSRIGVGTSLPAWPIDVENGAINVSGGYIYDGGTGVSTGQCLVAGSDSFKTFVPGACATSPTLFYQTVQAIGSGLTQQPVLNFDATLAATNGSGKTNVGLPSVGTAGTYTYPSSITFDAQGRELSVTSGSAVSRTCNSNGCYRIEPDGTIEQWGVDSSGCGSGGACSVAITFPTPFSTTTNLSVQVTLSVGNNSWLATGVSHSTTGFLLQYGPLIFVGGSGVNFDGSERATWYAIGN